MSQDIFGLEKTVKTSGAVASSEIATIHVGGKMNLAQTCKLQYGMKIREVTEIGSSNLYWLPGQSQGTLDASRMVGVGFFEGWTGSCGVTTVYVNMSGGKCNFTGGGQITADGAIIESVGVDIRAQDLSVTSNVRVKLASVSGY